MYHKQRIRHPDIQEGERHYKRIPDSGRQCPVREEERCMAASPDKDNPYRFKGYYYDEETGMYYLKSRYYQPEICRFISADDEDVLSVKTDFDDCNLYAYCDNNPISRLDETGDVWQAALAGGWVIGESNAWNPVG